ncbi:pyrimidine reductase family protein [Citricoccus sp. GCM10030269]|uniref:pyrimidine reductase family protein n=1 Tax=Citricoccus sp. GCM10030269 TaxID=3273388 RepID=UPI00360A0A90
MRALVHPYPAGLASPALTADLADDDLVEFYAPPGEEHRHPDGMWVRFNFVASADGAAELDGRSGGLGTPADRRLFSLLRRPADVILVGAGTLRTEGYDGALLSEHDRAWRRDKGMPDHPSIAVVSRQLDLDPDSAFFTNAPVRPLILTGSEADGGRKAALAEVAEIVECGTQRAEPARIRTALAERGHRLVHAEGGPTVFGWFAADRLADELCLSVSPLLAGPDAGRIVAGPSLPESSSLDLVGLLEEDGALFGRYRVRRS